MSLNYQESLKELLKYDIGRSAYFDVIFGNSKEISYLCHSAELPGESSATVSQKIYGVIEKFPIMTSYNDITLSFYTRGSQYETVRQYFMQWIAQTTGRQSVIGGNGNKTTYNPAYKKDISTTIQINHYEVSGNRLLECSLIDAFPLAISQTPLSWSAANQAISLNVTFAYTEYMYTFFDNTSNKSTTTQEQQTNVNSSVKPLNGFMSDINLTIT